MAFDQKEQKIINQGTAIGAVAGAAAGWAIAKHNDKSELGGALAGAAAGGLLGNLVGRKQADNARELRLENSDLQRNIAELRQNNNNLAAYNEKVARRIAELRAKPPEERARLAKADLNDVDSTISSANTYASSTRNDFVAKLPRSQANELQPELRRNDSERAQLASYRTELSKMSVASN